MSHAIPGFEFTLPVPQSYLRILHSRQGFVTLVSGITHPNTNPMILSKPFLNVFSFCSRGFLQIAGHKDLLEGDPYLKQRLRLRDAYITTLNVCQTYTLKWIRDPSYDVKVRPHLSKDKIESSKPQTAELVKLNPTSEYAPGLEDTLILTMKGIAAGMQNTG